jgi:hypothetical protein
MIDEDERVGGWKMKSKEKGEWKARDKALRLARFAFQCLLTQASWLS